MFGQSPSFAPEATSRKVPGTGVQYCARNSWNFLRPDPRVDVQGCNVRDPRL